MGPKEVTSRGKYHFPNWDKKRPICTFQGMRDRSSSMHTSSITQQIGTVRSFAIGVQKAFTGIESGDSPLIGFLWPGSQATPTTFRVLDERSVFAKTHWPHIEMLRKGNCIYLLGMLSNRESGHELAPSKASLPYSLGLCCFLLLQGP
jgi:hypothetical protein